MEVHRYNTRLQALRSRNPNTDHYKDSIARPTHRPRARSHLLCLPLDLVLAICSLVPQNDVACSVRLCCKALRDALSAPQHRVVRLAAPIQPHAFDWALSHGIPFSDPYCSGGQGARALDGLTYEEKLHLSELVAGTGVLPNLVKLHRETRCPGNCSTLRAAAVGNHLHVLEWLESEGNCLACVRVQLAVGSAASLAVLQWYDKQTNVHPPTLFAAACDDDVPSRRKAKLQYLYDEHGDAVLTRRASGVAARRGDLDTLVWLKERGVVVDVTTQIAAAGSGDLDVAMWVAANGGGASLPALQEAALEGHVAMMRWLIEQRDFTPSHLRWARVLRVAASGGHVAAVQWLLQERKVEAEQDALEQAAESGHCEVIRLLLQHGGRPSYGAFLLAAKSGSIAAMELLLEADNAAQAAAAAAASVTDGKRPAVGAAAAAVDAGGVRPPASGSPRAADGIMRPRAFMMAALALSERERTPAISGSTAASPAAAAATSGAGCGRNSVEVLEWLERNGCPVGSEADREEVMAAAARTGSRARVDWLRARGFGWSAQTFASAAHSGCVRLVEWMAAEGCPMGRRGDALLAAGANADADMLAALRRLGCPWAAGVLPRAVHGVLQLGGGGTDSGPGALRVVRCRLEVLQWMVGHGCPVTKQAYNVARMFHRDDVADWLKRSGLVH